jgi:hypothetical protein
MATIPLPLRGEDITVVTLSAQDANASTGVLGDRGTPVSVSIVAVLEELDAEDVMEHEDVSAITSKRINMVATAQGMRLRVSEIVGRVAASATASTFTAGAPKLAQLRRSLTGAAQPYCKIEWTEAGTPFVYYGSYAGYTGPRRGKGKQIASMTFEPVDIGGNNPTTAGS